MLMTAPTFIIVQVEFSTSQVAPTPPNPPLHSSCTPQCVPEQGNSLLDSCIHPGKRKTDLLALSFMCLFVVFVEMEPAVLQSERSFSTFHTNIRPEVIKYSIEFLKAKIPNTDNYMIHFNSD